MDQRGYINAQVNEETGQIRYYGYVVDILEELARRADFTYELVPPSGYGSLCKPRLSLIEEQEPFANGTLASKRRPNPNAYMFSYASHFLCGESDVNDLPLSHYSTDMYMGIYYITPDRLARNKFTLPYAPPGNQATLGMLGTATHVTSLPDLAHSGNPHHYKVCANGDSAYIKTIETSFPQLNVEGIQPGENLERLEDGTCDIFVGPYPVLKQLIFQFYSDGTCTAQGKPIGVIGDPLPYGLNYWSFGIREDLPDSIVSTLNYWLQALMACLPDDPNGICPDGQGSLYAMYTQQGGKGDECGYVQFPVPAKKERLPVAAIVAIAITPVVLVLVFGIYCHMRRLQEQEQRMKKRFIQQLARNIDLGPSAKNITAEKLSEVFQHIGGQDGQISKEDLAQWMNDLNLDFLSEQDFNRLWDTMDMDHKGTVDPVDFFAFLKECEHQFEEVHGEYSTLPKSEKLKLASRRLSTIHNMDADEVQKMERRNNKRQRANVHGRGLPESSLAIDQAALNDSSIGSSGSRLFGSIAKLAPRRKKSDCQ